MALSEQIAFLDGEINRMAGTSLHSPVAMNFCRAILASLSSLAEVRVALWKYGDHYPECAVIQECGNAVKPLCNCGFDALIKRHNLETAQRKTLESIVTITPPASPDCPDCTPPREACAQEEVVSPSNQETLDTLRDIEAYFRKEAAYERENMGAGGSTIALGMWKRYYTTLANLSQDLPELIAADRSLAEARRELDYLKRDRAELIRGGQEIVAQISDERAAAERELARLSAELISSNGAKLIAERDAERYRWFKSMYSATWLDAVTGGDGVSWAPCWELRIYLSTADESQLDAAIDTALAENARGEGGPDNVRERYAPSGPRDGLSPPAIGYAGHDLLDAIGPIPPEG